MPVESEVDYTHAQPTADVIASVSHSTSVGPSTVAADRVAAAEESYYRPSS